MGEPHDGIKVKNIAIENELNFLSFTFLIKMKEKGIKFLIEEKLFGFIFFPIGSLGIQWLRFGQVQIADDGGKHR